MSSSIAIPKRKTKAPERSNAGSVGTSSAAGSFQQEAYGSFELPRPQARRPSLMCMSSPLLLVLGGWSHVRSAVELLSGGIDKRDKAGIRQVLTYEQRRRFLRPSTRLSMSAMRTSLG